MMAEKIAGRYRQSHTAEKESSKIYMGFDLLIHHNNVNKIGDVVNAYCFVNMENDFSYPYLKRSTVVPLTSMF